MKEILSHVYRDENRGTSQEVVKEALLKTVEVENYLIAPIHKLLGTGNNIMDYVFLMWYIHCLGVCFNIY